MPARLIKRKRKVNFNRFILNLDWDKNTPWQKFLTIIVEGIS
jgi:hypothetical protein